MLKLHKSCYTHAKWMLGGINAMLKGNLEEVIITISNRILFCPASLRCDEKDELDGVGVAGSLIVTAFVWHAEDTGSILNISTTCEAHFRCFPPPYCWNIVRCGLKPGERHGGSLVVKIFSCKRPRVSTWFQSLKPYLGDHLREIAGHLLSAMENPTL